MLLSLDEAKKKGDIVVESIGVKVVFSRQIEGHVEKATVDYRNKWYDRGFRLTGLSYGRC